MTILRRNIALVMIGFAILMFLIAVALNGSETMNVAESTFVVNFLSIFSVLFMCVGIYNKSTWRRIYKRGHHFETDVAKESKGGP